VAGVAGALATALDKPEVRRVVGDLVDELLAMAREDAEALGCWPEVEHARTIVARGTSADRQVARFNRLLSEGATREEALRGVVDNLIKETLGEDVIPGLVPGIHDAPGSPD